MLYRYFLRLSYDGGLYHGWQVQEKAVSVQQKLEQALSAVFDRPMRIMGAGRTDTGVHSSDFWAHIDLIEHPNLEQKQQLINQLNALLPGDIVVYGIYSMKESAHARFSAKSRTYQYFISPEKDVFFHGYTYHLFGAVDYALMNEAAQILFDYKDFTSFSKLHTQVKTNNCRIDKAIWEKHGPYWVFTIKADRFLRNMVRAIVGTLLEVGKGKLDLAAYRKVIELKDRSAAGFSVPGRALFLTDIEYPPDLFIDEPSFFPTPPKPLEIFLPFA